MTDGEISQSSCVIKLRNIFCEKNDDEENSRFHHHSVTVKDTAHQSNDEQINISEKKNLLLSMGIDKVDEKLHTECMDIKNNESYYQSIADKRIFENKEMNKKIIQDGNQSYASCNEVRKIDIISKVSNTPMKLERSSGRLIHKKRNSYNPENLRNETNKSYNFNVSQGRGTKLGDILPIRNNIENMIDTDPIIIAVHKFLYPRGIHNKSICDKKLLRDQILEFNGYLPLTKKNTSVKNLSSLEENEMVQIKKKTSEMTLPFLKTIADLFHIDRGTSDGKSIISKDILLDRILDFLAIPDKYNTKNVTENFSIKSFYEERNINPTYILNIKERKRTRWSTEFLEKDILKERSIIGKEIKLPSDTQLRKWVRSYVNCFNLDKVSIKHAVETCSDKFKVNLHVKRERIKQLLSEEI